MSETLKPFRSLRKVSRLAGLGRQSTTEPLPVTPRGPDLLDTTPPEVAYYMEKVSRERAMRAYRLRKKGVEGTLPELLTYDWLESRGRQFDFQTSFLGGRLQLGGAVADFIIFDLWPGELAVWRCQGDYWHTMPEREQKDALQKLKLLGERWNNVPVGVVVDLWESAIYRRAPQVFLQAEAGVEIGQA